MTPEIATQLADHNARIHACEAENRTTSERLDKLLFLMLGSLAATVATLVVSILKH